MSRHFGLLCFAWILCVVGTPVVAANLVKNGSFETPVVGDGSYAIFSTGQKFTRWQVVGESGTVAVVSGDFTQNGYAFPARKGKQWLDLTGTGSVATGIQQTVKTSPGATYALTFYVASVYNPNGIFGSASTVDVSIDGSNVGGFTNTSRPGTTTQQWRKFSTEFVAANKKTTIALFNGDPSGDTENGLDAISVTLVSPGSRP